MNQAPQMQVVPMTKAVKAIIVINVAVWVAFVLVLQRFVNFSIMDALGLVPGRVATQFWAWQLFTYMFLHSTTVFHILFNMLVVWWFGAELEMRWGPRFFVTYYLVCGVGAGIIYTIGMVAYAYISGNFLSLNTPLVGASGATYGLLLAYGLLFGERIIAFMMLFPMKAKYFTVIIGAVELFTLLGEGTNSEVANLAHLGGIVVGFLFLNVMARWRLHKSSAGAKRGRRLKLVVDNERMEQKASEQGPKYWN